MEAVLMIAIAGLLALYVAMLKKVVDDVCSQPFYRYGTRAGWVGIVIVGGPLGIILYLMAGRPLR